jgi:APA family basic amino acid/polyamine antiporter
MSTEHEALRPDRPLLRVLGVGFGLAVSVGATIGIGILRTPGTVAMQLGSAELLLLVFALGAVYALLGANYTAELGAMLPRAGGPYVYAHRAYGMFGGFVVGWSDWIINTAAIAFLAVALGEYAVVLAGVGAQYVSPIAVSTLAILGMLQWAGLRAGSRLQTTVSALMVLVILVLVTACLVTDVQAPASATASRSAVHPSRMALLGAMILSFQSVIGTYGGWNSAVYFAEENTDPGRAIPRALLGAVALVTVVYLLILVALVRVLPIDTIAGSKLPAADAAALIFGSRGAQIVTVVALLSLLSNLNASFMFTPRTLLALGRDGLFSSRATAVTRQGTPAVALVLTTGVAIALAATGTFERLLGLYAFIGVCIGLMLDTSLIVLRRREPDLARPYRAVGYPWTVVLLLLVDAGLLVGFVLGDPRGSAISLGMLALSYPVFLVVRRLATAPAQLPEAA